MPLPPLHRTRSRRPADTDARTGTDGTPGSSGPHRRNSLDGLDGTVLLAAVGTGLLAGVGAIVLTELLHAVQHLAFGYSENTFLVGVRKASPERRVVAMTIGGAVVGTGWWALGRWAGAVPGIEQLIADPAGRPPLRRMVADAALQVVTVGFGASLGREGAPRQLGAALAAVLSDRFGLDVRSRRTMIACGAGAGLAGVYNVPISGTLFTVEALLFSFAARDVVPALLSSAAATTVAWPVLSNSPTYVVPPLPFSAPVMVWAVVVGPLAGLAGAGLFRAAGTARSVAPKGWRLPLATTAVFATVGALAIGYPELLGNGKGAAQVAFDGATLVVLAVLLVLKPIATVLCLGSGARGGLLTPAFATGALLGGLTGGLWSKWWPGAPLGGFVLIGAAAVLAVTLRAPVCAIALALEFTHAGLDLTMPLLLAVSGAVVTGRLVLSPRGSATPATEGLSAPASP